MHFIIFSNEPLPNFLSHARNSSQVIPKIYTILVLDYKAHCCLTLDLDLELFSRNLFSFKKKKKRDSREGSMNQGQIIEDLERKTTPKVIP